MLRILFLVMSATVGAVLVIALGEGAAAGPHIAASLAAAPAPIAGFALAFPAIYLLWEFYE